MKKLIVLLIVSGTILLATIIIGLIMYFTNESLEEQRINYMQDLGEMFYDKYFNDLLSKDEADNVKDFAESGLEVSLESLSLIDASKRDEIDELFTSCNKGTTYAIIFPKEPFGAKDFTIDVKLDCE